MPTAKISAAAIQPVNISSGDQAALTAYVTGMR
jgi:hypothetical protein